MIETLKTLVFGKLKNYSTLVVAVLIVVGALACFFTVLMSSG